MSDEEVKNQVQVESQGTTMYVHQVNFQTLCQILSNVTDVNRVFTYSMPNKAQSYAQSGFELINTLNQYIDGQEDWRIIKQSNVKLNVVNESITIGNSVIRGTKLVMCIPRINSILIIPDENCVVNGVKDPTKIIQLTNCIAVTPLLVRMLDEEGQDGNFKLGLTYDVIMKKPTQN